MKPSKYIYIKKELDKHYNFTYGKVYCVIEHDLKNNAIYIYNDKGERSLCYLYEDDTDWFVDATSYIREEKLNELGI